jgi:hypothetical protein
MYCIKLNSKYVRGFRAGYSLKPITKYNINDRYSRNIITIPQLDPFNNILRNFSLGVEPIYYRQYQVKIINLTNKNHLVETFEDENVALEKIEDLKIKIEHIISGLNSLANVTDEEIQKHLTKTLTSDDNILQPSKYLYAQRMDTIRFFEKTLKDLHKLKVVEFSPGICFFGDARKIRHAIQKKNTIANKTICSQCRVIIPTKEFFTIDSGSSGRTLNVCPFCIARMAEEARKILEKFTKDNPKMFEEYETQLVLRNL